MFEHGLVVGKFWPPHQGHLHLIDTAASQCEDLIVGVVWRWDEQPDVDQRVQWLQEIYKANPNVFVTSILNADGKEEDSAHWAHVADNLWAREFSVYVKIGAVFTSEPYGDPWAEELRKIGHPTEHVLVDMDRSRNPVSGSAIREDPALYWDLIPAPVREYYARRFCVVGGESTGKSTLVPKLAKFFGGTYTLEAGRTFVETYGADQDNAAIWSYIIRNQTADERTAAQQTPNGIVICDTDLLTTCVWYQRWVGEDDFYHRVLLPAALSHVEGYEHYFLLDHEDVPWIDDGTRSESENRAWFTEHIKALLDHHSLPYTIVKGSFGERTTAVTGMIREMLRESKGNRG
jgi:HTH-type transcriptional repressor of NAD biosynthesis genes